MSMSDDIRSLLVPFPPSSGDLILSSPYLDDQNFIHSVVFLAEHSAEGTLGFVLNDPTQYRAWDVHTALSHLDLPVLRGGPVQNDTIHYLHTMSEVLDSHEICPGIYWGGDFEDFIGHVELVGAGGHKVRLLLGYAGWEPGQLEQELEEESWIVTKCKPSDIFSANPKTLWNRILKRMGDPYARFVHYPTDPSLN